LFQLRSGHSHLNGFLSRFVPDITPTCLACGTASESVHHFLVACPSHRVHRDRLKMKLGARRSLDVNTLLSDPKALRPLFAFINATGRFRANYGDL
ncbi:hypothetical protein CONPUDRAFT_25691, partial [Coniophora puteana RWD-64-598 SS2]